MSPKFLHWSTSLIKQGIYRLLAVVCILSESHLVPLSFRRLARNDDGENDSFIYIYILETEETTFHRSQHP